MKRADKLFWIGVGVLAVSQVVFSTGIALHTWLLTGSGGVIAGLGYCVGHWSGMMESKDSE